MFSAAEFALLEHTPQCSPCTEYVLTHCRFADPVHRRYFRNRQIPDRHELEARTLHWREILHRHTDSRRVESRDHCVIGWRRRHLSTGISRPCLSQPIASRLASSAVRGQPPHDREEPRRKWTFSIERPRLPVHHRERLLHYVFRVIAVSEQLGREESRRADVATDQPSERGRVPSNSLREELGIRVLLIAHAAQPRDRAPCTLADDPPRAPAMTSSGRLAQDERPVPIGAGNFPPDRLALKLRRRGDDSGRLAGRAREVLGPL